ncbi:lysosomal dipeptide transporter MFSD1-like [Babylonia areolata]|uniref:lysosomal dipeptide transporter MFSD1-like n=1 Tax=Babylonia areolata TaxID=304850 RepID=UPI003FCF6D9E
MACADPHHCCYRFLVLFFNCMLTFGSYFCFDMPSVLQKTFTDANNCTGGNGTDLPPPSNSSGNYSCNNCTDCLGMSQDNYNLLYAIYAWTNAAVVIAAGFLIDKLGNRVGVFLFSFLCVLGSSTFAASLFLKGTAAMFPLMLLGRLIFGSGNGSLTIVQNRITAYWFKDKELAMAFGITLCFSRLGSVLNFFLTETFQEEYGLKITLWGGAFLCFLGFVSAIIVSALDRWGVKQLGDEDNQREESKKLKLTDIKNLSAQFWLVALAIMFFYNGVFPFMADASEFIKDKYGEKYGLNQKTSAYIAGAVYDVSMLISPFLGGMIDILGKRGVLAFMCALLTVPVFGILAFTTIYPLIPTIWLGITYSFAAASMWPTIPLVVSQATVGTAMGLTTSMQMIGIGICNLIVGQILGKETGDASVGHRLERWKYVMVFLLANMLCCMAVTVILNIVDKKRNGILNISRKQKRQLQEQREWLIKGTSSNEDSGDHETDPLLPGRRYSVN